jgi:tetratricopeptide (TPR) repeat protein
MVFWALFGIASQQEPAQLESLLTSAQQAQARGDFAAAAEFYSKAVRLQPDIAELRANLGLMFYQTGRDEQAIEAFRRAIRLKPDLFVPNLFLGLDYVKLKRFNQAIPYLKRAELSNPGDVQVQLGIGQAYAGRGNTRLAIRSYVQATQLDPTNANTWYQLGMAYLEQVESDARILFARHRDSGYLLALEAETLARQRAYVQAEQMYEKALASREFPPGTHAGYGFLLLYRHDLVGAERELNAELAAIPGSLMATLCLARLHVEQDAMEQGATELIQVWNADASFARANLYLFYDGLPPAKRSALQDVLKTRQTAGSISEEAVSLFGRNGGGAKLPRSSDPAPLAGSPVSDHRSSGDAAKLYAQGKYADCSVLLASRLPNLSGNSLELLAACAYASGRYRTVFETGAKLTTNTSTQAQGLYWETEASEKLAVDSLARASELDSSSPKLHVLLGDIYRQRKSLSDAQQEYRKALALQPEDPGALFGLCLTLLEDTQADEAFRLSHAALEKNPDDPELNAVMGEILCNRDDFSDAEIYLKKSLKTKPEHVAHVRELLSRVYAKTNRTRQAISELKLALPDDKDGHLHYQIARLYLEIGDRSSAKQALEESTRIQSEGLTRVDPGMQESELGSESQ